MRCALRVASCGRPGQRGGAGGPSAARPEPLALLLLHARARRARHDPHRLLVASSPFPSTPLHCVRVRQGAHHRAARAAAGQVPQCQRGECAATAAACCLPACQLSWPLLAGRRCCVLLPLPRCWHSAGALLLPSPSLPPWAPSSAPPQVRTNAMKFLTNHFKKGQLTKLFFLFAVRNFGCCCCHRC